MRTFAALAVVLAVSLAPQGSHPRTGGTLATMNTFLTQDGTKIVAATSFYPPHHTGPGGYVQITEYSAGTGKPLLHEDRFSASIGWQNVLWSSPDGSALVVSDPRGAKDQYGGRSNILGVLASNRFTPIPGSVPGTASSRPPGSSPG
jgi:hypothetical protein